MTFATEKHAKENWWCPDAVIPVETDIVEMWDDSYRMRVDSEREASTVKLVSAANRSKNGIPEGCKCLGTQCAYWRWRDLKQDRGYCGKAGRPFE